MARSYQVSEARLRSLALNQCAVIVQREFLDHECQRIRDVH